MSGAHQEANIIGHKKEGGTICAGFSPDTNEIMYVFPTDVPVKMSLNIAEKFAAACGARLPSVAELKVILSDEAKIGNFKNQEDGHSDLYSNKEPWVLLNKAGLTEAFHMDALYLSSETRLGVIDRPGEGDESGPYDYVRAVTRHGKDQPHEENMRTFTTTPLNVRLIKN